MYNVPDSDGSRAQLICVSTIQKNYLQSGGKLVLSDAQDVY